MSGEQSPPPLFENLSGFSDVLVEVLAKEARELKGNPKYAIVSIEADSLLNKVSGTLLGGLNLKERKHYRLLKEGGNPVSIKSRPVRLTSDGVGADSSLDVIPVVEVSGCVAEWEEHCVRQLVSGGSVDEGFAHFVSQTITMKARQVAEMRQDPIADFLTKRREWSQFVFERIRSDLGLSAMVHFSFEHPSEQKTEALMSEVFHCEIQGIKERGGAEVADYSVQFGVLGQAIDKMDVSLRRLRNDDVQTIGRKLEERVQEYLYASLQTLPRRLIIFQSRMEQDAIIEAIFPFQAIEDEFGLRLGNVTLTAEIKVHAVDLDARKREMLQSVLDSKMKEWERAQIDGEDDEADRLEVELERLTVKLESLGTAVKESHMPETEFRKLLTTYARPQEMLNLEANDSSEPSVEV